MTKITFLVFLLAVQSLAAEVTDLTPAFLKFWQTSKTLSAEAQVFEFKRKIVPLHAAFYEYRFDQWKSKKKDPDEEMKKIFLEYPSYELAFKIKSSELGQNLDKGTKLFKETFPSYKGKSPIFILHSLNSMDGGTRTIAGKHQLIFGVESMVQYHNSKNPLPFFHHELFHVHHSEQGFPVTGRRFYHALWFEGLATYVSAALNQGSTIKDIMLDIPSGLVEKCVANKDFLWTDLEAKLLSDKEEDYEIYFMMEETHPNVPRRAGYYFGYLIAKELGRTLSLEELVALRDPDLLPKIKSSIERLRTEK